MNSFRIDRPHFWLILVCTTGILYLSSLLLLASDGVYFSGDSGLKAMLSQDIARGNLAFDLALSDPPWLKALWEQGMFPFEEPFVYPFAGKYYISYPYTFSLISAPFYAALGYRGLYVIPFLSTLLLWLVFYRLCRKLELHPAAIATGLFFLIFATNLSLFGAIYWEHTLSVCLAFAGLALVVPGKGAERIGARAMAAAGVLTGLSVWLRPEQIFAVLFLGLVSLYSLGKAVWGWRPGRWLALGSIPQAIGKRGWVFLAAGLLTLLCYAFTNWLIYHNIFGMHSRQVLDPKPLLERLVIFIQHLQQLTVGNTSFFLFNPVALLVAGYLPFAWVRKGQVKDAPDWTLWLGFCLFFWLGVSALVPQSAGGKQWGPRFLLLLVPVVVLLFTWQLDHLLKNPPAPSKAARAGMLAAILIAGVAGVIQNPVRGRDYLLYNYNLVRPAVEALRADPGSLVAVSNPYLSQVFQPALDREIQFVGVWDKAELTLLSQALLDQGQDSFTYICYSFDCKLFEPAAAELQVEQNGVGYTVQALSTRDYGKYTLRKMRLQPSR